MKSLSRGVAAFALLALLVTPAVSNAFWKNFEFNISPFSQAVENVQEVSQLAAALTSSQIQAILSLLTSFGADQNTINNVEIALGGSPSSSSTGTLTAAIGASSPSYKLVAGGLTDVHIGSFKFSATGENVLLQSMRFYLGSTAKPSDLVRLTIWNGAVKVGEAYFTGNNYGAIATLTSPVTVHKDTNVEIIVKADVANIGTGQPGQSGDLIQIGLQYDFGDFYGTGATSGTTIQVTGSNAPTEGVRLFRSFPIVSLSSLPSSGVEDGRLMRFKVTADSHGDVSVGGMAFNVHPVNISVSNVKLFAFTDSNYSSPVSGQAPDGSIITDGVGPGYFVKPTAPIVIPASGSRYFELRGSVSGISNGGAGVTTTLLSDPAFIGLDTVAVKRQTGRFIWSPNTNGISSFSDSDWTVGTATNGLPISQTRTGGSAVPSEPAVTSTGYWNGQFFVKTTLSGEGEAHRTIYKGTEVIIGGSRYLTTNNTGVGNIYIPNSAASVVNVGDVVVVQSPSATVTSTGYWNGQFFVKTSLSGSGQSYRTISKGDVFLIGGKSYQTINNTGVGAIYLPDAAASYVQIGYPVEKQDTTIPTFIDP